MYEKYYNSNKKTESFKANKNLYDLKYAFRKDKLKTKGYKPNSYIFVFF